MGRYSAAERGTRLLMRVIIGRLCLLQKSEALRGRQDPCDKRASLAAADKDRLQEDYEVPSVVDGWFPSYAQWIFQRRERCGIWHRTRN